MDIPASLRVDKKSTCQSVWGRRLKPQGISSVSHGHTYAPLGKGLRDLRGGVGELWEALHERDGGDKVVIGCDVSHAMRIWFIMLQTIDLSLHSRFYVGMKSASGISAIHLPCSSANDAHSKTSNSVVRTFEVMPSVEPSSACPSTLAASSPSLRMNT